MATKTSTATVNKRYDFVLLFDVQDGNPNGDPDSGNMPRIDPQSMQGLVTDVCIKRKIRNAISVLAGDRPGTELYFQTQDAVYEKRVLNLLHQTAWDSLGLAKTIGDESVEQETDSETVKTTKKVAKKSDSGDYDNVKKARNWMCSNFYDVRAFGAVMTTGVNCGQVRGACQITFARSIDPIVPLEHSITRKSVTTEKDAQKQINKADSDTKVRFGTITGTMGRKNTIPYALYRCQGFVNPYLARDTGFSFEDLQLLWDALKGTMWEIDRSASRGLMCTRGLYVFEHDSMLGSAPAHELFDRIRIEPLGPDAAPRSFDEYRSRLHINDTGLPPTVKLHRMIG
jgi:CRISPR-associated protein Csd2